MTLDLLINVLVTITLVEMMAALGRSAQPDTSVAVKRNADRPSAVSAPIPLGNPATALKAGDRVNDPWLRAMIL